jgi:hypothetical protein
MKKKGFFVLYCEMTSLYLIGAVNSGQRLYKVNRRANDSRYYALRHLWFVPVCLPWPVFNQIGKVFFIDYAVVSGVLKLRSIQKHIHIKPLDFYGSKGPIVYANIID